MRNKRAQFFGLYLVFLTLLMCGMVVGLFYVQQGNINSSLVSPGAILEIKDDLKLFEMREVRLINEAFFAGEEVGDFCDDKFSEEFMKTFIDGISADDKMKEFIFSNLFLDGRNIENDARADERAFFENVLYSSGLGNCEGDSRVFIRSDIGKEMKLRGSERNRINFPVDFSYNFGREYVIDDEGVRD